MRFFSELKRRNVYQTVALFVVGAWVLIQVAEALIPAFCIPAAAIRYVWIAAAAGLPIALVFSWRFDLTMSGVRKTPGRAKSGSAAVSRVDLMLLGSLSLLAITIIGWMLYALNQARGNCDDLAGPPHEPGSPQVLDDFGVAALPCTYLSDSGDMVGIFAFGMHDGLLTELSRIAALRVISRTTMEKYVGSGKTLPEIGAELGVANILECSVQRIGNRVRINLQLIQVPNEAHIWAETYDRAITAGGVFELQGRVVDAVVHALHARMTLDEENCVNRPGTSNTEAYRFYLQGLRSLDRYTTESTRQAADYFEKAVLLDPDYAEALIALARTYKAARRLTGQWQGEGLETKTTALIDKALEINDCLGEAHAESADILAVDDPEAAWLEFERAVELSPSDADVHRAYGEFLYWVANDREHALQMVERAIQLNPAVPRLYHDAALILNIDSRPEEAIRYYRRAIDIDPGFAMSYVWLGTLYWNAIGQPDQAMYWLRQGYDRDPELMDASCISGWIYMDLGDLDEAERWFQRCLEVAPENSAPYLGLADLHHARGQHEDCWRLLNESKEKETNQFADIEGRQLLHLRYDSRDDEWMALMMDFAPYIFATGYQPKSSMACLDLADVATVLARTGAEERAATFFRPADQCSRATTPAAGLSTTVHLMFYALTRATLDDLEGALRLMRRSIDNGFNWMRVIFFDYRRELDALSNDPRYQAMMRELESRAASQLERVREMERTGEISTLH